MNTLTKYIVGFLTWVTLAVPAFAQVDRSALNPENVLVITIETPSATADVSILMRPDLAPNHVARVKELAREGFYDGHIFHRVLANFMAQTGDPTGTGTGGSGKNLEPEFTRTPHLRGTVSMARAQEENSADSQFFICLNRTAFLDNEYTVWGRVFAGMEIVDKIPLGEPPMNPAKMVKVRVAADIPNWGQ